MSVWHTVASALREPVAQLVNMVGLVVVAAVTQKVRGHAKRAEAKVDDLEEAVFPRRDGSNTL